VYILVCPRASASYLWLNNHDLCVGVHVCIQALGTVTGIINGSGSVTAAFGQMAIPVLATWGEADAVGMRACI
jgi:hypothetical protein